MKSSEPAPVFSNGASGTVFAFGTRWKSTVVAKQDFTPAASSRSRVSRTFPASFMVRLLAS